jgi:hypothetical protein
LEISESAKERLAGTWNGRFRNWNTEGEQCQIKIINRIFCNRSVSYLFYAFASLPSVWSPSSLENPEDSPLLSYIMSHIKHI